MHSTIQFKTICNASIKLAIGAAYINVAMTTALKHVAKYCLPSFFLKLLASLLYSTSA